MQQQFSVEFVQKLFNKIAELEAIIQKQNDIIVAQQKEIASLKTEITSLKERLNKNSNNSSKPPSSDGLHKPEPKSLRKTTGKSKGAQKGHQGKGFSLLQAPNKTVEHTPTQCIGCQFEGKCASLGVCETRYEVDISITTNVIAHESHGFKCRLAGCGTISGAFPQNITSTMQYGDNIKALAITLNTAGMVSINRTHTLLSAVFGVPISTGTIFSMVNSCAIKLEPVLEKIRRAISALPVVSFDETGTRVDKKCMWVHNASTSDYTYLSVEENRGQIGMNASGVMPNFHGIAVHDCWAPYWSYDATHALCNAHLLRELIGILENHPEQLWTQNMIALLLRMKKVRDKAVALEKESLSCYYLHNFESKYTSIIKQAENQNPILQRQPGQRGRIGKGKIRCLIDRLAKHKAEVCLFTKNFLVPFDNNQAERDVRMVKVKTKVSGCFRTKDGASAFVKIMSYIGTANKRGINSFVAIKNALVGDAGLFLD